MEIPTVTLDCAKKAGMSMSTVQSWDPDLWTYPLMGVHEGVVGEINEAERIEDEEGAVYLARFDCGCKFYVPSTMLKGTFSDELPGDVELDEPGFSVN